MLAKTAIVLVACVALAPAVATMAVKGQQTPPAIERRVELHGPIVSFSQTQSRIEVRLSSPHPHAKAPARIIVMGAEPGAKGVAQMAVRVKPGQTYVSAKLEGELAQADALIISVE